MMMQQRPFTHASRWIACLLTLLFAMESRAEPAPQAMRVGPEFQVNTFTADNQLDPAAAMDGAGNFVITWYSVGQDGSKFGIFAQRFDAQGERLGPEFQVNTFTTGDQIGPAAAMDDAGHFVIAWSSRSQDGDAMGVFAQRFNVQGERLGPEFRVNRFTKGSQLDPAIAMDGAGHYVITWSSRGQDRDDMGIFAQRFNAQGARLGPEFQVNTSRAGSQLGSAISMDTSGGFVISWSSRGQDGSSWGIYAQRFDARGTPLGGEFQVNTHTRGSQQFPVSAIDRSGQAVIAWGSRDQDGDGMGIYAQRFDAAGSPLGGEFQVNRFTTSEQTYPSIAMNKIGHFVITWRSQGQDGSGFGIFAQRFQLQDLIANTNRMANKKTK